MDKGARWATAHGVAKSLTRLSDITFTFKHHIAGSQAPGCQQSRFAERPRHGRRRAETLLRFRISSPEQPSGVSLSPAPETPVALTSSSTLDSGSEGEDEL